MTTTDAQNVLERYLSAVNSADADALAALYTDDARIFDSFEAWEIGGANWSQQVHGWLDSMKPGGSSRAEQVQIIDAGELILISAMMLYSGTPQDSDQALSLWNRWTGVLRRTDAGWKICHEHTSMPLSMSSERPLPGPPPTAAER